MSDHEECEQVGPKEFWCVRPAGHDRDHVATDGESILDVWANVSEPHVSEEADHG